MSEQTGTWEGEEGELGGPLGTGPISSSCGWAGPFSGHLRGVCVGEQLALSGFLGIMLGMRHESLCSTEPTAPSWWPLAGISGSLYQGIF